MADMEAGLNIVVGAIADEASAKKATKDLTKNVLGVLKDGYIEIPTAISDEFDENKFSVKLLKAQRDFIRQWKDMSAKGFSSSEKDLSKFAKKYDEFRQLLAKEDKKKRTKQSVALAASGIGRVLQGYQEQQNAINTQLKKILSGKTKPTTVRRHRVGTGAKISNEEVAANILSRRKRQLSGITSVEKMLGFRSNSGINPGGTNEYAVKESEYSPYRNRWMTQQKLSEIKAKKELRDTYHSWVDKNYTDTYAVNDKSKTSEKTHLQALANKAFGELSSMIDKANQGKLEDAFQALSDQIQVVTVLFNKTGKDMEETFNAIGHALTPLEGSTRFTWWD